MATWATLRGIRAGAHGSFWQRVARLVGGRERRPYVLFILPALAVIAAVIIFPWLFTVFISLHEWKITQGPSFFGLDNYPQLFGAQPFPFGPPRPPYITLLPLPTP